MRSRVGRRGTDRRTHLADAGLVGDVHVASADAELTDGHVIAKNPQAMANVASADAELTDGHGMISGLAERGEGVASADAELTDGHS